MRATWTTLALLLGGCPATADDTNPTPSADTGGGVPPVQELEVDVSTLAYVDLLAARILALSPDDAATSEDWHLEVGNRAIFSNGGVSGPGLCSLAVLDEPPTGEASALEAALPAPDAWQADREVRAFGEDWHSYNPSTGVFTAVPDVGYLVRGGEGTSYARLRLTELDFPSRDGEGIKAFTVSLDVQGAGESTFADTSLAFEGAIGGEGGDLCYDFDADAVIACTGATWDVLVGFTDRDFYMRANGGLSGDGEGGVIGPITWDTLATYPSATEEPDGTDLTGAYTQDEIRSLLHDAPWFDEGSPDFAPNHRIYGLDTDASDDDAPRAAFQVLGVDGTTMTLRMRALRTGEAR